MDSPQKDASTQPILVSGAHRSGTTWVGRMLASPQVAYISEPLNVWHRPGVLSARVKNWYQYICDENETDYLAAFEELLDTLPAMPSLSDTALSRESIYEEDGLR